jgi:flagellar motor switch protein FliN
VKTFLDAWLLEAPVGFSQELSGTVKLVAAEQLPEESTSLYCQIEMQGGLRGSFFIAIEASALARVLRGALITPDDLDQGRDAQLWQGMISQVAARALKAIGKSISFPVSIISVNIVPLPGKLAFTAYELHFGDITARIAFSDQTQFVTEVKTQVNAGTETKTPTRGVELLLDIELEASLRFGSKEMPLSDVLELGPGDVVQLERHVSDPVDLIVGDKIVARGEVVLVNGNFGLRVTEVAEPRKSLESIRCLF